MRILGISPLDKDSTATFMEDGHVVFACAEERLSRVKLQDGFPEQAVKLGFERTGWDPASIDTVAYAFFDGDGEGRLIEEALEKDARAHGPRSTAGSLRAFGAAVANGYWVNRTSPIPGFETEQDEFMPRKSWLKRFAYRLIG